jgi:hypothetical protein
MSGDFWKNSSSPPISQIPQICKPLFSPSSTKSARDIFPCLSGNIICRRQIYFLRHLRNQRAISLSVLLCLSRKNRDKCGNMYLPQVNFNNFSPPFPITLLLQNFTHEKIFLNFIVINCFFRNLTK